MSTTTRTIQSSYLKVPGAQLYYEVHGSGPVLLMIPGGPTDAGIFGGLGMILADRYTVVRYDPRGNSRSVFDDPRDRERDQDMDVHGDDVARLLASFGDEKASVLGSSGGAQIGLNLTARHPECLKVMVAHEPPCMELLPNREETRAFREDVYNTYATAGAKPAMKKFMVGAGLESGPPVQRTLPPPSQEGGETFARIQSNVDYFLAHGFMPIGTYVPDIAALRASPVRIVVGVGESSVGALPNRTGVALAEQLGVAPVSFAGGHGGYNDDPMEFAERLDQVLRAG